MSNNLVDMRDVRFVLYEQLCLEDLCKAELFQDHSKETFEMILETAEKLAVNVFEPTRSEGDEVGCKLENGNVSVPAAFHDPVKEYCEGGWIALPDSYEVGGQNAPVALSFSCNELFFAANYAITGYMGITHSAAKVIEVFGTDDQKKKFLEKLYSGQYAGAMVLTEAQAGSDVGALQTKAVKNSDGTYSITGNKIFITGGDQDFSENIIHIVLARIDGDPPGTKGLSCFVVPKIRVNDDLTLGERNDVICTGIEHKMGFKGSATCSMSYGENGNCKGELLGPAGKGIVTMFHMMNEQRVLVGAEGLSQGSTAYLHALEYARERLQGSKFGTREATQVPIITHPDVRRNLLWMKAYTEGLRSLIYYTVYCMDRISICEDDNEKRVWNDIVEVLTPICKAYGTEKGFEVTTRSMQVYGGYGFCKDYPIEQFTRDCKISTIFEGTNGIQALDLFGRKAQMRGGEAMQTVYSKIRETVNEAKAIPELSVYAGDVEKAVSALDEVTKFLVEQGKSEDAYLAYSWATVYLEIFSDVVIGWQFLWQAIIASEMSKQNSSDSQFYDSKIATGKFFISTFLPVVYGKIDAIKKGDKAFLEMGEDLFL